MADSLGRRVTSENKTIVVVARSKTKGEGAVQYEPFQDDGGTLDVTKWPAAKPAPTTVTKWSPKTSGAAGTVQGDTVTEE
jgi:hypothetical protein